MRGNGDISMNNFGRFLYFGVQLEQRLYLCLITVKEKMYIIVVLQSNLYPFNNCGGGIIPPMASTATVVFVTGLLPGHS